VSGLCERAAARQTYTPTKSPLAVFFKTFCKALLYFFLNIVKKIQRAMLFAKFIEVMRPMTVSLEIAALYAVSDLVRSW